ncbi:S1 family peptidase [Methanococcoides seepicolus]|uniref:Uncharacterized protein n=1 Tax=Methanococcoides seepicolus TaxID=2828780 RepID=A0A9E4ZEY7_9EURY|nr:S1 family peptidase [Methanococcoides seepicolus]MCM1986341.1 hypothetical protein [Methanococcoides seepicolus]
MNRNQKRIAAIVLASIVLITIAFSGFASAKKVDDTNTEKEDLKELIDNIPPTNPSILEDKKENKNVLKTKGKIPKITEGKEVYEWQKKLDKIRRRINKDKALASYTEDGTVMAYGVHKDGYFIVMNDENAEITEEEMVDITKIIDKYAKYLGISDTPIVFTKEKPPKFTAAPDPATLFLSPYFDQYRPIMGGIGHSVINTNANQAGFGTIGFAAEDNNNQKGFVIAGHLAGFQTGFPIYQPNLSASSYIANVSIIGTTTDVAFVPYDNVEGKLHISNGYIIDVDGYYSGGIKDMYLQRSGISSGYKGGEYLGTLTHENVLGHHMDTIEFMWGHCIQGDSGGPIYAQYNNRNKLVGTVCADGFFEGDPATIYIPCGEIVSKLGVDPLEA